LLAIHFQLNRYSVISLILSIFLVTLAPAANAVTKHLSMIDGNGQPLARTIITITAPDGSKTQKVTDDKAILEHDFKQSGVYILYDPAGNVIKTISIGGSEFFGTKAMTVTAITAGAALLLLAASSGGDSDSDSDSDSNIPDAGDPVDPGTGDGDSGDDDLGGAEGGLAGTYNVTASVASNPGNLPVLIDALVLQLEIIGTQLNILQLSSNANFPAQLTGTIAGESFTASSNGTYGGSQTLFQLAGSISGSQTLSFLINIGADGSLPGGQAVTYNATGTR
jgi:hypothetical protein